MTKKHKVFVSFHFGNKYDSQSGYAYKEEFIRLFEDTYDILVSKAEMDGDLEPGLKTETIRQKIRDEFIRDATVTVVLIGPDTWQRKHVDWEIASSIRDTLNNPRNGLIGILLPTHPDFGRDNYNRYTIPPRLHDNLRCGFAKLYDWNRNPTIVQNWIHEAFIRRDKILPDNSYNPFANNRSGERWYD